MQSEYIVIDNNRRKSDQAAARLLDLINHGAQIYSAVPTDTTIHYILIMPIGYDPEKELEEAQIIRDNLDAEQSAHESYIEELEKNE